MRAKYVEEIGSSKRSYYVLHISKKGNFFVTVLKSGIECTIILWSCDEAKWKRIRIMWKDAGNFRAKLNFRICIWNGMLCMQEVLDKNDVVKYAERVSNHLDTLQWWMQWFSGFDWWLYTVCMHLSSSSGRLKLFKHPIANYQPSDGSIFITVQSNSTIKLLS